MNDEPNNCPQCGTTIPDGAPGGMCPKCLLAGAAAPTEAGTIPDTRPRPTPPSVEVIAAAFPQLEIIELIGQGGMGFVFRARQPKLERDVALKILPQHLADDPKFAERFAREGKLLAKLNHPNIVSIFDFGESGGFYYLLMEFVDGVNLRQAMRASKFTAEQALSIVPKICEALQFAHEEGVLHRDIKPENILLDSKGRIKIADFGIAKLTEDGKATPLSPIEEASGESSATGVSPFQQSTASNLTVDGTSLGTPQYMAPEQLDEPGSVDHRADIYSLGVVFYELLTGELPSGEFKPPSSKTPVDAEVDEVVARALAKERERRQQSAAEFKTQIETLGSTDNREAKTTALPTHNWQLPASISCVCFYVSFTFAALFSAILGGSPAVYFAFLFVCLLLVPATWFFSAEKLRSIEKSNDEDRIRRSKFALRVLGVVAVLFALPSIGFGLFFSFALLEERGNWSPHAFEAVFVIATWLGMVLLPISSTKLLGATLSDSFKARLPRKRVLLGAAIIALTLTIGTVMAGRRIATQNVHMLEVHQETVATQKAWHQAGQNRFKAQSALDAWKAQTINIAPEEMSQAIRNEGAQLNAALSEAQAEVNQLALKLEELASGTQSERASYALSIEQLLVLCVALICAGTILFVSGLWSPRSASLAQNYNPWPRRIFILVACAIFLPVAFLGTLFLMSFMAYRTVESEPVRFAQKFDDTTRQATLSETNTLKAPLVAGFVELVAVARHPVKGQWWKPDGSYVGHMGFETHGSSTGHQPGNREYELVFKMVDLPDVASSLTLKLPRSSGWAGGGVRDINGNNMAGYDMFSVALPEEIDTTDAQIGIAVDRWNKVHEHDGTGFSNTSFTHNDENVELSWTGTTRGVERGIVQSVSHNLDRSNNQLRLVAILKDGSGKISGKSGNFGDTITAEFHDVEFDDVKGFRLESRPYTWINFPDVHLPKP